MNIEIYTDASVTDKKAVTSCLILTADNYLGCTSSKYDNVSTSLQGELLAIRDSLKYLREIGKRAPVTINCDSHSAISLVQSPDARKFRKLLDEIHSLEEGLDITYSLIKGHQVEHNPNKVVDLICNTVLRFDSTRRE